MVATSGSAAEAAEVNFVAANRVHLDVLGPHGTICSLLALRSWSTRTVKDLLERDIGVPRAEQQLFALLPETRLELANDDEIISTWLQGTDDMDPAVDMSLGGGRVKVYLSWQMGVCSCDEALMARVVKVHTACTSSHLGLAVGDTLCILDKEEESGWMRGTKAGSEDIFYFPAVSVLCDQRVLLEISGMAGPLCSLRAPASWPWSRVQQCMADRLDHPLAGLKLLVDGVVMRNVDPILHSCPCVTLIKMGMGLARDERVESIEPTVFRAVVIRRHMAPDGAQLDLHVGEVVHVLERDETGWWGGHKEGEDATGWFPGNCVMPSYH